MLVRSAIILITLLFMHPRTATADCLGCMTTYEGASSSAGPSYFRAYVKKCRAKQTDIQGELCSCGCKREEHTLHRHEYKYHEGKKLAEQPLTPLIKMAQKEKGAASHKATPSLKKLNLTKSRNYSTGTGALPPVSSAGLSLPVFTSSAVSAEEPSPAAAAGLAPPSWKSVTNDFM